MTKFCILARLRERSFHTLVCLFTFCVLLSSTRALRADIRSVGRNQYGQLGDGTLIDRILPVHPLGLTGVVAVSAESNFSLALKSDGTVWAWGLNDSGQLGDNTTVDSAVPVQVVGLTSVTAIQAGASHSVALKSDGTVCAWGTNGRGQLGDGTLTDRQTPVQVLGLTGVIALAAGREHSVALKSDGTVWTWGANYFGELGDGTTTSHSTPVNIGLTGIIAIATKQYHCLALKSDGMIWSWGLNSSGQLGDNTTTDRSTPVPVQGITNVTGVSCADGGCSYALKSDGTVWSWGNPVYGALGLGDSNYRFLPAQISHFTGIAKIVGGTFNCFALKADGSLWAWGKNNYGELGLGRIETIFVPEQVFNAPDAADVAAGADHTLFLTNPLSGTLTLEGIRPDAPSQPITFLLHPADNSGDITQTVSVPPAGDFVLANVPANTYTVHIKGAKYLAKNVTVQAPTGAIHNITATLKTGDANNDNAADIGDLLVLITHYNQTAPAAGYLDAADFNGDGANDIADLLLLIGNYNQMGD